MYFKLAIRNVRKSFKDYLIYFLTIAFSICLFYTFNSFQEQQAVLEMNATQNLIIEGLQQIMSILSVIVSIVLAFLIIYANNFLIKRRKKELGLYTLLGMEKSKISLVLIIETFLIGLLSLIVGIFTGLITSQLLTVLSANLFAVNLNYHFIFSMDATVLTIFAFALIFFIIMIFNSFILNKYKLIDLLHADQKHESLKTKNIYISFILFALSILLLGYAYYTALSNGINAFLMLGTIIPAGLLGTLLLFMSLSGFLLRFIQSSKHLYFKKLNMFVLRQINSSINSNFFSMSIICIMLLFSIGALSTGLNINATITNTIVSSTPYDYSYISLYDDFDLHNLKNDLNVDTSIIKEESIVSVYHSDNSSLLSKFLAEQKSLQGFDVEEVSDYQILPLSHFNYIREHMKLPLLTLNQNEGYLFTTTDMLEDDIHTLLKQNPTTSIYGNDIQIVNDTYEELYAATTTSTGLFMFCVVLNDNQIPADANIGSSFWNVNFKEGSDVLAFETSMDMAMDTYNQQADEFTYSTNFSTSREEVEDNSRGLSVTFTYVGLYLGFVFLIASAVILALQQLSQASDNRKNYVLLRKIGADEKTINHSMLLQLGIYFIMPLLLAIVHSIVGIQTVSSILVFLGKQEIFIPSLITGGIIVLIYGSYFLITYICYKRILKS